MRYTDVYKRQDPYLVRGLQFNKDCGLYCILAFDDDRVRSLVEGLLQSLSFSGVGGKRSVGFGKFQLECCGELAQSACEAARVLGTYLSGEPAAHWKMCIRDRYLRFPSPSGVLIVSVEVLATSFNMTVSVP